MKKDCQLIVFYELFWVSSSSYFGAITYFFLTIQGHFAHKPFAVEYLHL